MSIPVNYNNVIYIPRGKLKIQTQKGSPRYEKKLSFTGSNTKMSSSTKDQSVSSFFGSCLCVDGTQHKTINDLNFLEEP